MIADSLLPEVLEQVAMHVNEFSDVLVTHLRKSFPGVHFSICSDDDMPPRLPSAASNACCQLYYVDSAEHCLKLSTDAETATGLVVALSDGDD